jgi:signal transduction histidine kinase
LQRTQRSAKGGDRFRIQRIPQDVSVCLFRIVQEGLINALRHSGARQITVDLRGLDAEIQLTIRDSGRGFDPTAVENNRGLGLVSMRERVGLVSGTISIVSKPAQGAEIAVRIPVAGRAKADQKGASA